MTLDNGKIISLHVQQHKKYYSDLISLTDIFLTNYSTSSGTL